MLFNVQQFVAGRQLLLGRRIFRVRNPKLVAVVGDVRGPSVPGQPWLRSTSIFAKWDTDAFPSSPSSAVFEMLRWPMSHKGPCSGSTVF
jgi:hypothetical protein